MRRLEVWTVWKYRGQRRTVMRVEMFRESTKDQEGRENVNFLQYYERLFVKPQHTHFTS